MFELVWLAAVFWVWLLLLPGTVVLITLLLDWFAEGWEGGLVTSDDLFELCEIVELDFDCTVGDNGGGILECPFSSSKSYSIQYLKANHKRTDVIQNIMHQFRHRPLVLFCRTSVA